MSELLKSLFEIQEKEVPEFYIETDYISSWDKYDSLPLNKKIPYMYRKDIEYKELIDEGYNPLEAHKILLERIEKRKFYRRKHR